MNSDPHRSSKNFDSSEYEFFKNSKGELVPIVAGKSLSGFLVYNKAAGEFLQARLVKTEDTFREQLVRQLWHKLFASNDSWICPEIKVVDEQNGIPFYISSLPFGEPVSQYVSRVGNLPIEEVCALAHRFVEELIADDPMQYEKYAMTPESIWITRQSANTIKVMFGDFCPLEHPNPEAANTKLLLDLIKFLLGNQANEKSADLFATIEAGPQSITSLSDHLETFGRENPRVDYWHEQNKPLPLLHQLVPPEVALALAHTKSDEAVKKSAEPVMASNESTKEAGAAVVPTKERVFGGSGAQVQEPIPEITVPIDGMKELEELEALDQKMIQKSGKRRKMLSLVSLVGFGATGLLMAGLGILALWYFKGDLNEAKNLSQIQGKVAEKVALVKQGQWSNLLDSSVDNAGVNVDKPAAMDDELPAINVVGGQGTNTNLAGSDAGSATNAQTSYNPNVFILPVSPTPEQQKGSLLSRAASAARSRADYMESVRKETAILDADPSDQGAKARLQSDVGIMQQRPLSLGERELDILKTAALYEPKAYDILISFFRQNDLMADEIEMLVRYAEDHDRPDKLSEAGVRVFNSPAAPLIDRLRAREFFIRAAGRGDINGMFYAGECLVLGRGGPTQHSEGVVYLEKAVEQGHADAMNLLGECYRRGWGVDRNEQTAFQLFESAAEAGNTAAIFNLGACYAQGQGVERDAGKAADLFYHGSRLGDVNCMLSYGRCLHFGVGREENYKEAAQWMSKAAQSGSQEAIDWCRSNGVDYSEALAGS